MTMTTETPADFTMSDGRKVPPMGPLLAQQASAHPTIPFCIIDDDTLTFADLYQQARAIAKGLIAQGYGKGDRIGVLMPNCPEFMVAFYAIQMISAVAVVINARYKVHELRYAIAHSDISLLFTTSVVDDYVDYKALLAETFPDLGTATSASLSLENAPELKTIVLAGQVKAAPLISMEDLAEKGRNVAEQQVDDLMETGSVDDVCVMLYTSGTTAAPKGCQLTQRGIYQTWVLAYPEAVELRAGEKMWVPMPCFHIGGIGLMTTALAHGVSFLTSVHHQADKALRLLRTHRPEHLYPGFFTLFLPIQQEQDYRPEDVAQVRSLVAIAPYQTHLQMKSALPDDILVLQLFGMSEASGYVTLTPPEAPEDKRLKTMGQAIRDVEVRIVDPESLAPLPPGIMGEIQFRGPNAFHSYYRDAETTAKTILDGGWVRTGDLGTVEADGTLTYISRLKDMLKVGGENVAASEIEAYLGLHPSVKLAQVISRPDDYYGEVPVAFIELLPGKTASSEDLTAFCKGKLANFKIPRDYRYVTEWPMSATKIKKHELNKYLSEQEPA